MRHGKRFNHLGRTKPHRKAMLSSMASSLIMHKRIKTTVAKAKALRQYVEPIITRAKEDTTHSRRMVFHQLQDKESVTELFREVSAKIMDRPGGYTRILKTGTRLGDHADMCFIELVDYNENLLPGAKEAAPAKKSRRRRKKKGGEEGTEATVETTKKAKDTKPKKDKKEEQVAEAKAEAIEVPEVVEEKEAEVESTEKKEEKEEPAETPEAKTEEPTAETKSEDKTEKKGEQENDKPEDKDDNEGNKEEGDKK